MVTALGLWLAGWLLSLPAVAWLVRDPEGGAPGDFAPRLLHFAARTLVAFVVWPLVLTATAYRFAGRG